MKKMIFALLILSLSLSPALAMAAKARGQAAIPPFYSNVGNPTFSWVAIFALSNTTNKTVSVTITLYDKNGVIIQDAVNDAVSGEIAGQNVTNYVDNDPNASATFDIAANSTSRILLRTPQMDEYGYGRIEWKQSNSGAVAALVAHGFVSGTFRDGPGQPPNSSPAFAMPINGGLPF